MLYNETDMNKAYNVFSVQLQQAFEMNFPFSEII